MIIIKKGQVTRVGQPLPWKTSWLVTTCMGGEGAVEGVDASFPTQEMLACQSRLTGSINDKLIHHLIKSKSYN